jgi:hypothetical protein
MTQGFLSVVGDLNRMKKIILDSEIIYLVCIN